MAARKKRVVWRISDIVRAICKGKDDARSDNTAAYVIEYCMTDQSADDLISVCRNSLTALLGLPQRDSVQGRMPASDEDIARALVATAKRLRVPRVPA